MGKGEHRQRKPTLTPGKVGEGWAKGGHRQRKPTLTPGKVGEGRAKGGHRQKDEQSVITSIIKRVISHPKHILSTR